MRSLFFVTVYFCSKWGLFYFSLYSYGNGRIGVNECSTVSGIPISWSSRFLDPLDKMPLVARGHVTYLILNYWIQPTNPKDWNSITQKSESVKCDFMVVWMTQKIRCIDEKVAGSHALWSYIFFPFKNLPNFTGIPAPKYLSLLSQSSQTWRTS